MLPNEHMNRVLTSAFRCWRPANAALALVLLCASGARAQNVTEPSLKAAFLFNFATFTGWPQDALPETGSFVACVLGDDRLGDALEGAVKGRQVSGRAIVVSRVQSEGPLRSCHLLYVSGVSATQIAAALTTVRDAPILTISDADDFAQSGGIAHLFVENGRMRFDINLGHARRSRLQLSSKLLALATSVLDTPAVTKR
jgi:hypothetical protein